MQRLETWGLFKNDVNPVARSNVCPEIDPPSEPSFYAFSYTVPGDGRSFVAAGSGEARDGAAAMPSASSGSATSRRQGCATRRNL